VWGRAVRDGQAAVDALRFVGRVRPHPRLYHTLSHFYNANSYGDLDFKNTLTHKQRNASIR